jgi:putative addiction module antidote
LYNASPEQPAMKLQLKKIGNSTGLILPKELLARLGLEEGDALVVSETPDGLNLHITKGDETFERGLEIARKAMKTYHNALKELAK